MQLAKAKTFTGKENLILVIGQNFKLLTFKQVHLLPIY